MASSDLDSLIRDRAYALWEAAGRPCGHEHQHWADARRQIEHEYLAAEVTVIDDSRAAGAGDEAEPETIRMRDALYRPEPFSFELFGKECPAVDQPIVLHAENGTWSGDSRIAA